MLNETFLSPMSGFVLLPSDFLCSFNDSMATEAVLTVTTESIFKKLSKLNPNKAHGPDGIPSWLLKENTDLLAGPVTDILNCSYREGGLPQAWKEADIVAIPKSIYNHLRPISLTPVLSKLTEDFVVDIYLKPAVMDKIDKRQFGNVPKSCTTHALISMLHAWTENTAGNGSTTRVALFDFRKAFDLINHRIPS